MADIGFIGAGRLATGLAMALHAHGYPVAAVASRTMASAQRLAGLVPGMSALPRAADVVRDCDLVFITTPDGAIEGVARSVRWQAGQGAVHCSGALSLEALVSVADDGAAVASFHPLQTLSSIQGPDEAADRLSGICYALEGEGWLASCLEEMAVELGGQAIRVPAADRALYHQAAVFACGYVTVLLQAAEDLWAQMGFSPGQARAALGPLARATVVNYCRAGADASVTGPIARGDLATVEQHLETLRSRKPDLGPLARELGLRSLAFAPTQDRERLAEVFRAFMQQGEGLLSHASPQTDAGVDPTRNRSGR